MRGMGTNVTRWSTFDNYCLFRTFTGGDDARPYPTDGRDPSDIDVTERFYALYGLANFESQEGSVTLSRNIGLRWVKNDITPIRTTKNTSEKKSQMRKLHYASSLKNKTKYYRYQTITN